MRKFFLLFFVVFMAGHLPAQFFIKGMVLSSTSYNAVAHCSIALHTEAGVLVQKSFTDKNGYFILTAISSGDYKLMAYETGYSMSVINLTISANKADLIIELKPLQVVSDEILVESIKNKKPLKTTFTNLTGEEVKKLNYAQDLPVILGTTPSAVYTSDAGAGIGYSGIRIRGIDATRVNVTINGVPYNDPESHSVYWVDLPDLAGQINSLQVQRGIGTSTNGGAAFGSSINIETTKGNVDAYTQLTTTLGSYRTFKNNIKFGSGMLRNHWNFEGSLTMITSDGYIDRAASKLKSGYGTITRYGDKSLLKFIVLHGLENTYQAWDGVPQDSLPTHRTYNGFTYKNQTDNYSQTHYQLLYSYAINAKLNVNTVLHYTQGKGYYESYYANATLSNYGLPDFRNTDTTYRTNADLIARKWLDNDFLGVVSAVIYKEKDYEINGGVSFNNYIGWHNNEVIWSDVWTAPKPNTLYEPFQYKHDKGIKNDGNVYGKIYYTITKHVHVFADLQMRLLSYNFNDAIDSNITCKYLFFNPKIGADFSLRDSSHIMVYYGQSAHEPTRDEFVQSTMASLPQVEYLSDFEMGYSKKFRKWNLMANLYSMHYKNQLVLTGRLNDVGNPVRENVRKSYRRGIELIVQHELNSNLSINSNVTYAKNSIQNYTEYIYNTTYDTAFSFNYKTTPISLSPSLIFGSSIKYTASKYFEVELISKYVSKQFLDNSGSDDRKLNSYFVNDVYLRYHFVSQKLFENLNLNFVLYNIFNTSYESNGYTFGDITGGIRNSYNYYYPQALQHFALMLQVRL